VNELNRYLDLAKAFIKKHRFWVEIAAYVLIAVGTAVWLGRNAYAQAATLSTEGQRLEGMRRGADSWLSTLQPASSAEAQDWMQIQGTLQQLGSKPDSRLTLLEVITRRAERTGLRNVRASLIGVDSIPALPRVSAPPVTISVAPYAILVEFRGNFAATRTFLATLPPAVTVQQISISKKGAGNWTRAVLTVYEAVANAPI
jgi:hypothetical protein